MVVAGVGGFFERHQGEMERTGHVRSDLVHYRELGSDYRRDFAELAYVLAKRRKRDEVLATLDLQLMAWWVTFRRGKVLNPDPFSTPLPDAVIERRLVALASTLGMDAKGFVRFITQNDDATLNDGRGHNNIVNNFSLSHNKYHEGFSWHLRIPVSEQERLGASLRAESGRERRVPDRPVRLAQEACSRVFAPRQASSRISSRTRRFDFPRH
jgi:hypothetical protein